MPNTRSEDFDASLAHFSVQSSNRTPWTATRKTEEGAYFPLVMPGALWYE